MKFYRGIFMKAGKKIFKKNEPSQDESVTYSNSRIERIYLSDNFDIGRYRFQKDIILYIDPIEEEQIVKSYLVLDGSCMDLEDKAVLETGDLIVVENSDEMISLHMLENTTLLIHAQRTTSIDNFKSSAAEIIQLLNELQNKDHYTKEHSDRVFHLAKRMGLALGYHSKQIYNLNKAARFHDIGKVYIENDILNKPSSLSHEEYKEIQKHVELGQEMILESFDPQIYDIILQHHERIDGSGYPYGLLGDAILEEAKILAICDSYDAMTTDRVYKKGKSKIEALEELKALAGMAYDERLVHLFIELNTEGEQFE